MVTYEKLHDWRYSGCAAIWRRIIRVVAGLVNRRIQVTPLKTYAAA